MQLRRTMYTIELIKFKGYHVMSSFCRTTFIHGGSYIFVRDNINCKSLNKLKKFSIEKQHEFSGIHFVDLKIIIVCFYRSPTGDFDVFNNGLESILCELDKFNCNILLFGDFNLDFMEFNFHCRTISDLLNSFNLIQQIFVPTRITSTSSSCIDNFFTSLENSNIGIAVFDPFLSDHHAISVTLKVNTSCKQNNTVFYKHDVKETNLIMLIAYLSHFEWSVLEALSADAAFELFFIFLSMLLKKPAL